MAWHQGGGDTNLAILLLDLLEDALKVGNVVVLEVLDLSTRDEQALEDRKAHALVTGFGDREVPWSACYKTVRAGPDGACAAPDDEVAALGKRRDHRRDGGKAERVEDGLLGLHKLGERLLQLHVHVDRAVEAGRAARAEPVLAQRRLRNALCAG